MNITLHSERILLIIPMIVLSCDNPEVPAVVDRNAVFNSFSTNGQTLPSVIHTGENLVRLEVNHNADITHLIPEFETPSGYWYMPME